MPEPDHKEPSRTGLVILALVLVFACWIHLPSLGHPYLPGWDEAIHAAVSANLSLHPLEPTLVDDPMVPLNFRNWQDSQVWLHMPPVPFWQSALGIWIGGRSFFWMRLPAFLLFLGTIICIYWLGLKIYGQSTGLLGAIIFTSAPFGWLQVQGYHFGDMTDVSLAFWLTLCAVSVERALSTSQKKWIVLAGASQAVALLTKSALALAPVGAIVVIFLLSRTRLRLKPRPKWTAPLIHLGIGLSGWAAWRLYASHRWPLQWAHEAKVQWLHVTTSYEGHGRPWDALFNDLLGNLFTPAMILLLLAATVYIFYLATRQRRSSVAFHALWLAGTSIPLVLVKTKVPGILFGITPALSLASAALMLRMARIKPGKWAYAVAMTPMLYSLTWKDIPHDWFGFAAKLMPDMAAAPYLPTQLGIAASIWLAALVLSYTARRLKLTPPLWAGRIFCAFFMVAALGSVLSQQYTTRRAFEIIADYNPVLSAVDSINNDLAPKSSILIEGVTNGRQRPALTASFLTGRPARLARRAALRSLWNKAIKKGKVYLLTRIKRQARAILSPDAKNGWWVYSAQQPPPPVMENTKKFFARYPDGPDLLRFSLQSESLRPGQRLEILSVWKSKGPIGSHMSKIVLQAIGDDALINPWPIPRNFPDGILGVHLHNLSPPGLLWGFRPFGTGMGEPERWNPGWTVADQFFIWIPRHLKPGRYKLVQEMISAGQIEKPLGKPNWPIITVVSP